MKPMQPVILSRSIVHVMMAPSTMSGVSAAERCQGHLQGVAVMAKSENLFES